MDFDQTTQKLQQSLDAAQIEIVVISLGGEVVTKILLDSGASVRHLKAAISKATGVEPVKQCLSVGDTMLSNDEAVLRDQVHNDKAVSLCIYNTSPIHSRPGLYGSPALEITSVRIAGTNVEANLDESPKSILARATGKEEVASSVTMSHALFWSSCPVEGDGPVRDGIVELIPLLRKRALLTAACIDDKVAVLSLQPRPGELSPSSLLHGLPDGRFFGTHSIGASVYGSWGWLCIGRSEIDATFALRCMTSPMCGNTEPSGVFLVEYLGTMQRAPVPETLEKVAFVQAEHALKQISDTRDTPRNEIAPSVTVEVLWLSSGRMAVHRHAPEQAVETRFVPQWTLLYATNQESESVFFPMCMHLLPPPPPELESIFMGRACLKPVPGVAHVSLAPKRYDSSWLQRFIRRQLFG